MIQLRSIRLIQWYHFEDKTLDLSGSALLLGDNGSGKSTVLDAIQLALVADLNQVRFNRAANERSTRSAYTYVRGKLGADSDQETGTTVRWLRGAATGYVLLEFADTDPVRAAQPDGRFVVGLVMTVTEHDTTVEKDYLILANHGVRDIPAVAMVPGGRMVRTARDFKPLFKAMGGEYLTDMATYRGKLRQRIGPVPESFHHHIVKGYEFKPMGTLREFVFQYLAEPIAIQTGPLLQNLEHYKSMEREAAAAETRIAGLEEICRVGQQIVDTKRTLRSHHFMTLRADVESAETAEEVVSDKIDSTQRQVLAEARKGEEITRTIERLEGEREQIRSALATKDVVLSERRYNEQLKRVREESARARDAIAKRVDIHRAQTAAIDAMTSEEARGVRGAWADENDGAGLFPEKSLFGASVLPERVAHLRSVLDATGSLDGHDLRAWSDHLKAARGQVQEAGFALSRVAAELGVEERELREELRQIDDGRVRYPDGTEALLHLLKQKLVNGRRTPQPLCELIDVTNERWRDAVEAVLGNSRFDILVAPEDYQRVSALYEQHRHGVEVPRRGLVKLQSVGVIDIEKCAARASQPHPRSLAQHVRADDPLVQAYINYALGGVICCEDVKELRQHHASVTPTVMIYRGYVVRHPPEKTYRPGVIGVAARVARRAAIEVELQRLAEETIALQQDQLLLNRVSTLAEKAIAQVEGFAFVVADAARLPGLKAEERDIQRSLEVLRASSEMRALAELRDKADMLTEQIEEERDRERRINQSYGELKERQRKLLEESEHAHTRVGRARDAFELHFPIDDAGSNAAYETAYTAERAKPREPHEIFDAFENVRKAYEGRVSNLSRELLTAKSAFNNKYGEIGRLADDGYEEYRRERDEWVDSRLPEFKDRMQQAREQATEQLALQVVSQLGESFGRLERGFRELNRALEGNHFGTDRYQFVYEPAKDMRHFYDLVKEATDTPVGPDSLFGGQRVPEALRVKLDELVSRLTGQAGMEKELTRMTDYREYYRYDMRIHKQDETYSSFEAVSGDNSGGETQTPYYIAILSSMLQMYRSLHADRQPRCGLVLLDEAFSKMDGGRIASTLRYATRLGLQLVMATPKEKIDVVSPHVETCLLFSRDDDTGAPSVSDFARLLGMRDDEVMDGAKHGAPHGSEAAGAVEIPADARAFGAEGDAAARPAVMSA